MQLNEKALKLQLAKDRNSMLVFVLIALDNSIAKCAFILHPERSNNLSMWGNIILQFSYIWKWYTHKPKAIESRRIDLIMITL